MWIFLSIIAGLADSVRDALSKRAATTTPRPLITWSYSVCALPFFLPILLSNLPESVPDSFWGFLLFTSTSHVIGGLLLVRALQLSDLSLCAPMMAFTPVFLLVIGPLLTGDIPSGIGIIGALLVAIGSYVLNISQASHGWLGPIKAIFQERGSRIMLVLAFIWSLTGSVDRLAVKRFDLIFWASAQLCAIAVLLIPVLIRKRAFRRITLKETYSLLQVGTANAISIGTYLLALQVAPVHYVICLKRLSIPFSVVLGRLLFNEPLGSDRLPGAILMLIGVALISLFQ